MKKRGLFFVVIIVLVLVGCQSAVPGKDQQTVSYRSGSEGLRISFLENLPPNRLFDNEDFNAVVQVENRGASDAGASGDKVYLSGFDPSIITGISTFGMQIPPLLGKNPRLQEQAGGLDTVYFKGRIASLKGKGFPQFPAKILATTCYQYETVASPQVCIDPNPFSPTLKQKVCSVQNAAAGTQGAPIAVTSVDVDATPGSTKFKVHVANVGGGRVFRYGLQSLLHCSPFSEGLGFNELDYIEVQDVIVSDVSIKDTCRPSDNNHVRLTGGQGMFYCEFNRMRGTSAYQTPLIIKLRYGYETTVLKNVDIYSSA